jgi:hypothetical protein
VLYKSIRSDFNVYTNSLLLKAGALMITVASFREASIAHIAKGKLEAEGIPAAIVDENLVQINWTLSHAIGGVKVQVPSDAVERAREILAKDYEQELIDMGESFLEAIPEGVCPKCGSTSLSVPRYSLWSLVPSLVFLLPIFFRRRRHMCNECGTTWRN